MRSVASPATVPECIGVASYSTRANTYSGDMTPGSFDLSYFSGRGPRIDGTPLIDIAAPGNSDIISAASQDGGYSFASYDIFGGTSAAGPHVAAATALLLQDEPTRSPDEIAQSITAGAVTDGYMGTLPDEEWGYGKMQIKDSLIAADTTSPTAEVMVISNPLLPDTSMIMVLPSESLGAEPSISIDSPEGHTGFIEMGYSWWLTFADSTGFTVTVSMLQDLAGNTTQ